jgi:hypothetical protein
MANRSILIETRLGRLARARLAVDGLSLMAAGIGLALCIATLVGLLFWSGWLVLAAVVAVAYLAWRWLPQDRVGPVARLVEVEFPAVRNQLVVARELASRVEGGREGYSGELLAAAVAAVEEVLVPLPLDRLVPRRRLIHCVLAALAGATVFAGARLLLPRRFGIGIANAFAPNRLAVEFVVLPGDTTVLPGAAVELRCVVRPAGVFRDVRLETRGASPRRERVRVENDTARVSLSAGDGFGYRFGALSASSVVHRVRVLQPVTLERLEFELLSPAYTGIPPRRTSNSDISTIRGTVVRVEGKARQLLTSARLAFGDDTADLEIAGADSTRFGGSFKVVRDAAGELLLADAAEGTAQPAATVRVRALADEPPFVRLYLPGRDIDLPVSMRVLLGVTSIDDFGLGELALHWGRDSTFERRRLKSIGGRREDTTRFTWDLSEAGLLPGDELRYYVTAADNDAVSGPKVSRSETYTVRFPTLVELHEAAIRQTERTVDELGPMQSEQEQLGAEVSRLTDEMKRNRELSWDEKQALGQMLDNQQGLLEQAQQLREDVRQLTEDLSQGMMLDQETMNRLGQLQELLGQLLPRELQESLARLREKLEKPSAEMRQALERFQQDQEKFRAAVERALELMKRIAEEQRLEALARKAEDLARTQQELTDRLGSMPPERSAALEQEVSRALDSLQQGMRELADSMSDRQVGESLAALADAAEQQGLSDRAQQLQGKLAQGKRSEASQPSRELARDLDQLSRSLDALSKGLKQKRASDAAQRLTASAADLLMVSDQQEQLEGELAGAADLTPGAQRQAALREATRIVAESLQALSMRSMDVPPRLVQDLSGTMRSMQEAGAAMVENRGPAARQGMATARQGLNRAAQQLLESAASAMQGGMMGGMQGLMEQLSKLASGQMGVNADMNGMPMPIPGGMSPSMMEALARILGRQQALRQQLEQMMQSMGGEQPGLTSSLEGVLDEMRAVERDLASLNVTRQLIDRQESILSRLLDVQRSIRQQGFKEERESESGKPFELRERPRLPADRGERTRLLREELMRALKRGYPAEYELMIRQYFERLLNEE